MSRAVLLLLLAWALAAQARVLRQAPDASSYYLLATASAAAGQPAATTPAPQQAQVGNRMPVIDRIGGYDAATIYSALGSGINVPIAMTNPMYG